MKSLAVAILFLFTISTSNSQNRTFTIDKLKDSIWLKELIALQNKKQAALPVTDSLHTIEWTHGKVVYSPDKLLRIGQITGEYAVTTTIVQYFNENKAVELKLAADTNSSDFQHLAITDLYKMPGKKDTYLALAMVIKRPDDYHWNAKDDFPNKNLSPDDYKKIENIYQSATLLQVAGDSLKTIPIETENDDETGLISYIRTPSITPGKSVYLESSISHKKHSPKPYLKYDPINKKLSFLYTYYNVEIDEKAADWPFISLEYGSFKYNDTTFVIATDTTGYYPALELTRKVLAVKKFKTGNYITKATASQEYEEIGAGIINVYHVDYDVQSQNISSVDQINTNVDSKTDIKPDFRVQKDGGLIFLVTDVTTPNHSGMCGSCDFEDSQFWLIKNNKKKLLFSFSSNSNQSFTTYGNGKSEQTDRFYLKKLRNEDNDYVNETVVSKWLNNSTYVFTVSNDILYRNFYVRFVNTNGKTVAKVEVGKLLRVKKKQGAVKS